MPIVYKEVEVEIEIELDDFETEDLVEELKARGRSVPGFDPVQDAFTELFHYGVPLDTVLHNLFKEQAGYNYALIEKITKQGN